MTQLLEVRSMLISIYKKFDLFINPIAKFIVYFLIIISLNKFFAHSEIMAKVSINFAMAVLAAFLPGSWFVLLLLFVVALQIFTASMEAAIIVTALMLVAYLLFARIQPKYSILIILVPFLFSIKLAYIVPVFAGLFLGPAAIVPVALGIGVYQFSTHIPGLLELSVPDSTLFSSPDIIMNMYDYTANVLMADKEMILLIVVFSAVIIVMYFIGKLEFDFIWYINIGVGAFSLVIMYAIVKAILGADGSVLGVIGGALLAIVVVAIMQFFRFTLDYKRSERLQFEDDEYYYYVRTVPKVTTTKAQKEIKRV